MQTNDQLLDSSEFFLEFKQYWLVLKRRSLPGLVVFISVFVLLMLAVSRKQPIYIAQGKLLIKRISGISSLTGLGKEIGNLDPLVDRGNPLITEGEIIRSDTVIKKTLTRLQNKNNIALSSDELLARLSITDIKGTDILKLSYTSTNPEQAAAILNTLMVVYLENNVLLQRAEATTTRKFIEEQQNEALINVRQAEEELRIFKEKNKVISLSEEADSAVELIKNLEQQITKTQSEIANINTQFEVLQKQVESNTTQARAISSLSQSSGVQEVLKELQEAESKLIIEQTRLTDFHPTIIDLKSQVVALQKLLKERAQEVVGNSTPQLNSNLQVGEIKQELLTELFQLEAQRSGLTSELNNLYIKQGEYDQKAKVLSQLEKQQQELTRKLENAQSRYSLLLPKLQEIRITENQNVGNVRLISIAQIPTKSISSSNVYYLASGLLGFISAFATIYFLEITDKSITTIEQVKKIFGFNVLGLIPSLEKAETTSIISEDLEVYVPSVITKYMKSPSVRRAYQMLRAKLAFLYADKEVKAIVVTSSVAQEGKSELSANLAIAMTEFGYKVLLIDADMLTPQQHHIWELSNQLGLYSLIVDEAESKDSIQKVMPGLDILTAGKGSFNSMALLNSQKMISSITQFSEDYDFVIIDTPALNVAAGAQLSKIAAGVLFVVHLGVIDSVNANVAKALLLQSGQTVLGQVVNGILPNKDPHSSYFLNKEDEHSGIFPNLSQLFRRNQTFNKLHQFLEDR